MNGTTVKAGILTCAAVILALSPDSLDFHIPQGYQGEALPIYTRVTAPSLALETSLQYLANTPVL